MTRANRAISVVISTRYRGEAIVLTLRSIQKSNYPNFEIVVVDQNEGDETAIAMRPFLEDSRIRHVRTSLVGLSSGRNLGVRESKGEIIAVTDDDCEPAPDWLEQMNAAFDADERIGVVFGITLAAAHDRSRGFIPAHSVAHASLVRRLSELRVGMGACMAFRRDVWQTLQGFDEMLGVGAFFRAGEEGDFAARALLAGYRVSETPGPTVIHHGFRPLDSAGELAFSYWYGTGAALAKLLKCRPLPALAYLIRLSVRWVFHPSAVAASFGSRSSRWGRLAAFIRGWARGLVTPVNRRRGLFASQRK